MSSTRTGSTAPTANNKRTRLDRSLKIVFGESDSSTAENANETPSRRDNVDGTTERLYRLYGASLIQQSSRLLSKSGIRPSTCITALVIFQRLYHRLSLRSLDVWAAAMGALFCAAKTEEVPLTARQVIVIFNHLYRKRRMFLVENISISKVQKQYEHVVLVSPRVSHLSYAQRRQQLLQAEIPPLSSTGPIWKEWFDALVHAEGQILRSLGFLLYWIPNEHAHRFAPGFLKALGVQKDATLCQNVWNACNDAYRLDLCVRFPAEVICTAAILISVESLSPDDWWTALIGPNEDQALSNCANMLLGIQKISCDKETGINLTEVAFLKPLAKESFNGPDSFIWEMAEGNL